jgi:N6-L-threonylcarbamoyladenine synthase
LKTFASQCWKNSTQDAQTRADIACAFQLAVVDSLTLKAYRALTKTGLRRLVVAGGVSANELLRSTLQAKLAEIDCTVYYPELTFCTDNGAMIAYAGYQRLQVGQTDDLSIKITPRWSLDQLSPL